MTTVALDLVDGGYFVFPVDPETKRPFGGNGHLDATNDAQVAATMFSEHPNALAAINTGRSGVVVLDIDRHDDINGFESLEQAWYEVPDTWSYDTKNSGKHVVYKAPADVPLNPRAKYRGMEGVDRRAGSSYAVIWSTEPIVPVKNLAEAPEWLCDAAESRSSAAFEGTIGDWFGGLVEGNVNTLVSRAKSRISEDMSHSDMVARTFEAVRLGAEGNPGVHELIEAIESAWMNRPSENHSTPESEWAFKFNEALASGIAKYGESVEEIKALTSWQTLMDRMPARMLQAYFLGDAADGDRRHYFKAIQALVHETTLTDSEIASALWFAPNTRTLATEWGIGYLHDQIRQIRNTPVVERENPVLAPALGDAPAPAGRFVLLSGEEREYNKVRPTFVDRYQELASRSGFSQPDYARACAWTVISMAFGFRAFIPVTKSDKMGLNLWMMVPGKSGTGKSRAMRFMEDTLNTFFQSDLPDNEFYRVGADSSPQGINLTLLHRDRRPTILSVDEATRFFRSLGSQDWMSTLENTLSHWYEGKVDPSSKISLKEMRGKGALTSFNIHMFATPDQLTENLSRDMFLSGFLARFSWTLGPEPVESDDRFAAQQQVTVEDYDATPPEIMELATDLAHAALELGENPKPILATQEALSRISQAHKTMFNFGKTRGDWTIVEPSITRLAETLRKCASINAIYRGSFTVELCDVLSALESVEIWFNNLFTMTEMVAAGDFQRDTERILAYIKANGGEVTETRLLYNFRNMIQRDPRELDARLTFLERSGRLLRKDETGKATRLVLNGE